METLRSTTICAVRRNGKTAIAGDGQVTMGNSVVFKGNARKVRRIYGGKVITGFAGTAADAFSLYEKFEEMLNKFSGNLMRSAVELAQLWRRDKALRQLEAMMIVADSETMLIIAGNGDVIEPEDDICAIGSGGNFALAAAKALVKNTNLPANEIAQKSLEVASDICIFTNKNIIVEEV